MPEPEEPHYTFPDDDLLWDLIKIYFEQISPYSFPLLHKPTFERAVTSGHHLSDHNFGATVLAVCSLASRHSDDPRNYINAMDYEQLIGWKWFRQIRLVRPSFVDTVSLYELQLYCVCIEVLYRVYESSTYCRALACFFILIVHNYRRCLVAFNRVRHTLFPRERCSSCQTRASNSRERIVGSSILVLDRS